MRIVAGAARGRRLVVPPGDGVRPTAARVREALFSSLAPLLPGAAVLDAFAGSGALGLEARSRGAHMQLRRLGTVVPARWRTACVRGNTAWRCAQWP